MDHGGSREIRWLLYNVWDGEGLLGYLLVLACSVINDSGKLLQPDSARIPSFPLDMEVWLTLLGKNHTAS